MRALFLILFAAQAHAEGVDFTNCVAAADQAFQMTASAGARRRNVLPAGSFSATGAMQADGRHPDVRSVSNDRVVLRMRYETLDGGTVRDTRTVRVRRDSEGRIREITYDLDSPRYLRALEREARRYPTAYAGGVFPRDAALRQNIRFRYENGRCQVEQQSMIVAQDFQRPGNTVRLITYDGELCRRVRRVSMSGSCRRYLEGYDPSRRRRHRERPERCNQYFSRIAEKVEDRRRELQSERRRLVHAQGNAAETISYECRSGTPLIYQGDAYRNLGLGAEGTLGTGVQGAQQ